MSIARDLAIVLLIITSILMTMLILMQGVESPDREQEKKVNPLRGAIIVMAGSFFLIAALTAIVA